MIVDQINAYLSSSGKAIDQTTLGEVAAAACRSFDRQFGSSDDRPAALRLSSIGHCPRKQAYKKLNFPENGKTLDARAKMVFFQGDMAELAILELARLAGIPITDAQKEVEIDGILGHVDGIWGDFVVECKSMPSYRFTDFQRGIIDLEYKYQFNAYMLALGKKGTIVVGLNKDAGVLHEVVFGVDPEIARDIRSRITTLKNVTKDTLPPRAHQANDKGFYPWQCLYCAYWKTCLPNAEQVLVKNAYRLKEKAHETTATK